MTASYIGLRRKEERAREMMILCLVILAAEVAASAKIFSVLPVTIQSHNILYDRLMKELASRGHQITFLTPYQSEKGTPNIREIVIPDFREMLMGRDINPTIYTKIGTIFNIIMVMSVPLMSSKLNDMILQMPEVQKLINEEEFDLVFGEPIMDEALIAGIAYKNKAPIVALHSLMPNHFSSSMVGNPTTASYLAEPFYPFHSHMSFLERTFNLMLGLLEDATLLIMHSLSDHVMRKHFGEDLPHLSSIIKNTSLLLINNHPALNFPRPQMPNTIDVAGMHIYPPMSLPKELDDYMSSSKQGVILFSLGTNLKSSDLGANKIRDILAAFSRLEENVLWKFEHQLEDLPPNVKIATWLPQSDVLAHPNLKLLITHGGLLSMIEAVFHGIPVLGIPFLADQPINIKYAEHAAFGVTLHLDDITTETFYHAVTQVLTNPKYKKEAKRRSKLIRDAMSPPLETAVWWIEYVLRYNGAPHLRSAAQDLNWFQLHQFDTIPMVVSILVCMVFIQVFTVIKLFKYCCRRKKTAVPTKKKQ